MNHISVGFFFLLLLENDDLLILQKKEEGGGGCGIIADLILQHKFLSFNIKNSNTNSVLFSTLVGIRQATVQKLCASSFINRGLPEGMSVIFST